MLKKTFCALAAFCATFAVFAANGNVAKVGDTEYATIQAAIAAATDGQTVTVIADHELPFDGSVKVAGSIPVVTCVSGKSVTIDLNGKKLTTPETYVGSMFAVFAADKNGQLTICDSAGDAEVRTPQTNYSMLMGYEPGTKLIVKGGNFYLGSTDDSMIYGGGASDIIYIEGGCFTFEGVGRDNNNGSNGKPWIFNMYGPQNSQYNHANVSGGTYNFDVSKQYWKAEVNIPDDFSVVDNGNGTWTVCKVYAAKIGDTPYTSLEDAFAAAQEGDTITLLQDLTIESALSDASNGYFNIAEGKSLTLNLNSKKITVSETSAGNFTLFYIYGELTVRGNGTIELRASNDRGWNASSSIFQNRGGVLTIENGTFKHLGGTAMAFVVDNNANSYGDAVAHINGGKLSSTYIAIRNRMDAKINNNYGKATLNVSGGEIAGTRRAIWGQVSSADVNKPATGEINVTGGEIGLIETDRSAGAESLTTISGGTVSEFKGEVGELKVAGGSITGTTTILGADGKSVDYAVTTEGLYVKAVAKIADTPYATVLAALQAAANIESSETVIVKLLDNSREVMPTDVELLIKSNVSIVSASGNPVAAKFYNKGTNYDFIFNSATGFEDKTLTIGENVTFQLEDRIIWAGYYGNNINVVVDGVLAGYQYWHGADTTVNATGLLKTTGEALVLRRGATLTVDNGKVDANYFSILAGNIVATNNAEITSGPIWVSNKGGYANEGAVSIELTDSTWTSSGNLKLESGKTATIKLTNSDLSAMGTENGDSVIDSNSTIIADKDSELSLKALDGNGTVSFDIAGMSAGDQNVVKGDFSGFTGTLEVINNDKLNASIVDGKIVLALKPLSGQGTQDAPYVISDLDDLIHFSRLVNAGNDFAGKFVKLTADIDMTDVVWTPIGSSNYDKVPATAKKFAGSFDGENHTITGLSSVGYIPAEEDTGSTEYSFGLFGYVYGADIKNVKFAEVNIECGTRANSKGVNVCGSGNAALVGYYVPANNKTNVIENCHVLGGTVKASNNMGGLIGHMDSQISQPKVNITIRNCSNAADVTTEAREAGGILGLMNSAREGNYYVTMSGIVTFENCVNTGAITSLGGGAPSAGGILGRDHNQDAGQRLKIVFDGCTNSGLITVIANDETHAAGIGAGFYANGAWLIAKNCVNTGNVVVNGSGKVYAGGLISYGGVVELLNSTSTGTVTGGNGNKYVGSAHRILFLDGMNDYRDTITGNTYYLNGGTSPEYSALVDDAPMGGNFHLVETAHKENYEFAGWYTNPEFTGNACTALVNNQKSYYAKWSIALAGSGTEENPYLITSVEQLIGFRDSVNAGETKYSAAGVYVKLGADIDLAGINWVGIGSATADHGFMGNFDGKGYKVKNLTITDPALDSDGYAYAGLFAVTEGKDKNNQNVITNLTIENVTIDTTGHIVSAAIAYPYYTTVENVKVCGNISIKGGDYTAGALAYTRRCVDAKNISVVGNAGSTITGNKTVGGVISDIQMNGALTANYSNFNASGLTITGDMHVGGISGIISKQTLNGCSVKDVVLVCSDARVGTVSGSLGDISVVADETIENVTGAERVIGASYKDGAPVEAKVGDTYYFTVEQALAVAKNGDTVTLLADIEASEVILIDKNLIINGNGHKVTSSATRVFRVTTGDTEVTLNDVNMVSTAVRVGTNDIRGISIDNVNNVKLTLNNCSVDFTDASANDWAYAVNVTGGSNHTLTVNGGTYEGANVINVRGANSTVTVQNATLNCTYPPNSMYEGACVYVLQEKGSSVTAKGNTFTGTNAVALNLGTGTSLTESNNTDNTAIWGAAKIGNAKYATFADAWAVAVAGDTITLLADLNMSNGVAIEKAITIDLNAKKVTATSQKAFEVYANATIKNGTIEAAQRCVDTRKAVELTLTDVKLIADKYTSYGNPQPFTIGGSEDGTKVTMTDVEISAAAGYGIITFVKTELTATGSTIGGYNALYVKPGSEESTFNFVDCDLSGSTAGNDVEGNSFSTIAVRANDVTVNIDADSTLFATGNYCWAISADSKFTGESGITGAKITVAGTITGQILTSVDASENTVSVKAEYADKLNAGGFATVVNNGMATVVKPVAKIGETYYETLQAAVNAAQEGDTVQLLAVEISEGTVKLPATLKNVTIKGTEGTVLKDMTVSAADGNSYSYIGLTFDGITFDNSRLLFSGWRNGDEVIENFAVVNCEFKNLDDTTNTAPVHFNKDGSEPVKNFTFRNNKIDGATGGSKSGIYLQATGNVVVENNVINNVAFRPYVIQITTDDGIADNFVVSGNTFSGSAVGRAQGLGNNAAGTDNVVLNVNNNIFKGITDAQQICYWNFNATTTTANLSNNYYDIDIVANPGKIYYNSAAQNSVDLIEKGVYPFYTELNADGTINVDSLVQAPAIVAQIGNTKYLSLVDAFKAATSGCTIEILADVVVDYYWDARNTGAKFTVPVTINGNDKTIKFTNTVYDGGNYLSAFRFEAAATVKNLTIDMSEAVSGFAGRFRAISAKGNLTVDNCSFIGNGSANNTRAIIFGEGAGAATADVVISITNSTFTGWKRGVSDNENAQNAKSVTLTGNNFTDASVNISASESVAFTGNTVTGSNSEVIITSYNDMIESVTVSGNTLADGAAGKVEKAENYDNVQAGFAVMAPVFVVKDGVTKYYNTLVAALKAAQEGSTVEIVAGTHEFGAVKFPAVLKNVTIRGAADKATVVKNSQFRSSDGNSVHYAGITFDGIVFDSSDIVFTGARNGEVVYEDWTITNCEFRNIKTAGTSAVHFNLASDETFKNFTFTDNTINGVLGNTDTIYPSGLRVNYLSGNVVVRGNNISDVCNNAIQFVNVNADTLVFEDNILASNLGGVANLYNTVADTVSIVNNQFLVLDGQKALTYITGVDVSGNYWNGKAPVALPEGVTCENYYTIVKSDGALDGLVKMLPGRGTEASPFVIANVEDLILFRDGVNNGETAYSAAGVYVVLTENIDLSSIDNWTPIGVQEYDAKKLAPLDSTKAFCGIFNGNGKVISNLKMSKMLGGSDPANAAANLGLFGVTGEGAVIKNLTISNVTVNSDGRNVAAVVGHAHKTTLENITVNGKIDITGGHYVAGICGLTRTMVAGKNLTVSGAAESSINGQNMVGGIFPEIQALWGLGYSQSFSSLAVENIAINGRGGVGGILGMLAGNGIVTDVSVKNVALTGRTDYKGDAMGRIRMGVVAGLMGGKGPETIANIVAENVSGKNLDGNAVVLPVIGANYDASSNATEAKIGDKYYALFQDAFNALENGDTLTLLADVAADVTVAQAPDTVITIDGNGKNWAGTITVDGKSEAYPTAALTIKNVNFNATGIAKDASINLGDGSTATRYVSNLTVEDCSFTGAGQEKAAIKSYVGGDKNLVVKGCTVADTMHSLLQAANIAGVTIDDCEVYSKNGINLNSSSDVEIKNSTVVVSGYAVRAGASGGESGKITLIGNTLSTSGTEDAVIVLRGSAQDKADIDISKNIIEGETHISGVTGDTEISADANFWGADKSAPVVVGTAIDVTTYYKDRELTNLGYCDPAAVIGSKDYATLQEAINAVKNGETIVLVKDCAENVKFKQKANLKFTIDGADKTYTGKITVAGRATGATLTITNVNFVSTVKDRQIVTIDDALNVTIDGCSFTGDGTGYGIKLENANNNNIVVKNTTASKLFDFVYSSKAVNKFTAEDVTVTDVDNGFQIASGKNLTFKNVTVEARVEGVAFDNNQSSAATFENCKIKAERPFRFAHRNDKNAYSVTLKGDDNEFISTTGGKTIIVESTKAPITVVVNDADFDMSKSEGLVAQVGSNYFNKLQKAVDAAANGETVTVLSDFELTWDGVTKIDNNYAAYVCVAGKAVTIDLNGKKLTGNTDVMNGTKLYAAFASDEGGALTLKDSVGTASVKVTGTAAAYCLLMGFEVGCKLTVEGGVYELANASDSLVFAGAASDIVTVNGGTFTLGNIGTGANSSPWIFNANGKNANSISVTGGTFNADVNHQYYKYEVSIPRTLACKANGNGTWTIVPAVAYVNELYDSARTDVGYATFAEAIAAAEKYNGVATILAGTYTENLNVNKAVTVVGETDAEGNNLVSFNGKLNVTANGAIVRNINFKNTGTACYVGAKDVLIEGCSLEGSNGLYQSYTSGTVTFKDSVIKGATYGIHFDGSAGGNIVIDNCVITGWTSFASTINKVTMTDTTFAEGNYNYVRFYQDAEISNCTFNANMNGIDLAVNGSTLTVADSTFTNGDIENLFASSDIVNNTLTVDGVTLMRVATIKTAEGTQYFKTLADAFTAAMSGNTIKVISDAEIAAMIEIPADKTLVLDLNGKTVNAAWENESAGKHVYAFTNKGGLEIKGDGTINTRGIFNYGDLVLESGTINAIDGNGGYGVRNYDGATFEMNGGLIATTNEDGDAAGVSGAYDATTVRVDAGAAFEMNGGEISNICNYTFAIENYGETVVNGGTITSVHTTVGNSGDIDINGGAFTCNGVEGVSSHVLWAEDGTALVTGGTFDGKDNYNGFNVCVEEGALVSITGGTFLNVHSGTFYGEGTVEVSGGQFFDKVPANRCEIGYFPTEEADANGMYGVRAGGNVAYYKPNGTVEFRDGLQPAGDGYTIKLLADVTVTKDVVLSRKGVSVTLDLNGKTLTNNAKISTKGVLTVLANGGRVNGTGTIEPDGTEPFEVTSPVVIADKSVSDAVEAPTGAVKKNYSETQAITFFVLAVVDGVEYYNINDAINAALESGKELVLKADVELDGAITVAADKSLTIDLDDNTLSGDVSGSALIVNEGVLSLTGGKVDNTDNNRVADVENKGVISVNGTQIGNLVDKTSVAVIEKADGATRVSCQTLGDAVSRAATGDTVKLLKSVTNGMIKIQRAITVDLNSNSFTTPDKKAFEVYADATIKNGAIVAANRCVDTRTAVALTLSGLKLTADTYTSSFGNPQPLTIGGNDDGTAVVMENVAIDAGVAGYGIITFVQTELAATNCTIAGYSALYVTPGSENSEFNFVNCDLSATTGNNDVAGNSFSVIAVQTDNVKVNVDADSTIKAEGNHMYAVSLGYTGDPEVEGNEVVIAGVIEGNILDVLSADKNLIAFKAEYTDALEAEGYALESIENGMVRVLGAKVAEINGVAYVSFEAAVAAAQAGDEVKILVAGTYKVPTGKNITITGAVDGVVFDNIGAHNMGGASMTFNNVTFNYAMNSTYKGLQHSGDLVYNNCTINGQVFLYGASETFNNCVFNQEDPNSYNVWTYSADPVEFNDCTFNCAGKSVLIYKEGGAETTVSVAGSTFNASAAVDGKAAIEMDSSSTAGINLTITGTTVNGFGNGNISGNSLWNNKKWDSTDANNDITVVVDNVTVLEPLNFVAYVGKVGYTTITDAINGAQDGDTVRIVAGTFDEKIAPWASDPTHAVEKSITIEGAEDFGTVLTGGLYLGRDDSSCRAHTVTVKGIAFEGKGVLVAGQQNVVIEGNRFTNITAPVASSGSAGANAISVIGKNVNAVITGNVIDTTDSLGIMLRNVATAQVTGNTVANTKHNSIQITAQTGAADSEVTVANNTLSNWGLGSEGRAMRISGIVDVEVTGNVMTSAAAPEEFVKVTGATTIDASANYWNGEDPTGFNAWNFDKDTDPALTLQSYYTDAEKKNLVTLAPAAAKIGEIYYRTLADALSAAKDGETVELVWATGFAPVTMNGAVYGKTVTITGNAEVDWSKGFLFVGRGGEGDGTVIFKNANLDSKSNSASYGIHVSGREKGTNNKYNGTVVISNSTIVLDYLINKGEMTLDASTLTVKNGFAVGGRPASETESGEDATATIALENGSTLTVNNHNGMGLGYEAIGVMTIDASSTFTCTQDFLVTAKGHIASLGTVTVAGTLTNNGMIELDASAELEAAQIVVNGVLESAGDITGDIVANAGAEIALSGGTYTEDVAEWCVDGYASVANGNETWTVTTLPESGLVEDGRGVVMTDLAIPGHVGDYVDSAILDVAVKLQKPAVVPEVFKGYKLDLYVTVNGLPAEGVECGEDDYIAGDFGPAGKLFLSLDGMTLTDGMTIPVLALANKTLTYGEVLAHSGDFRCGIHLGDSTVDGLTVTFRAGLEKDGVVSPYGKAVSFDLTYYGAVAVLVDPNGDDIDVYYEITDALAEALNGDTVKLLTDATEMVTVPAGLEVTIDLDGKTLSGSILAPNANLTVKNGTIVNENADVSAIEINAGTLALANVEIESARHALRIDGNVVATIDGGTYKSGIGEGTGSYHALNVSGAADVTVKGGTFVGPKGTSADSGAAVCVQSGSKVTIDGGDFSGGKNNTLVASGSLTVTGGTYDQDPAKYLPAGYATYMEGAGFGVMKCIMLDIKVVDNMPFLGYAESDMVAGGTLILKATSTLDGTVTWTTITSTKDDALSTADGAKDWVKPAEGYKFFTGGVAK